MSFDPKLFTTNATKYIVENNLSLITINTPTYPVAGRTPDDPNLSTITSNKLALMRSDLQPYLDYASGGRIYYLNNQDAKTTDVYMGVFDKFVGGNKLKREKVGIHNYQNEISRPMCKMGSCWDANMDE
jgi:hypothetical protein